MANSGNYTATKEDARQWRTYNDTLANSKDEAAVASASTLQTATRSTTEVTAISTLPATVTLDISEGQTSQLVTTSTPANKIGQLTYTSSNPTKATVSATGLVTPVAAGSATITVREVASNQTDTCVVTVQA